MGFFTQSLLKVLFSWGESILPYNLVDYFSTKDASPSPEVFMGAIEFFIDHFTQTTTAFHFDLPVRFIRLNHFY